jgi:uncharacterized RDD family membrane protein YckC
MENCDNMINKQKNNQIELYIKEVSSLLPYPQSKKKMVLDELRIDVQAAMKDSGGELPSLVFDDPREVAKNICQAQNWHRNRASWSRRFFAWLIDIFIEISGLIIYLGIGFLFLILFIYPFDDLMQEFSNWESGIVDLSIQGIILIVFITILTITTVILFVGYNAVLEYYFSATIGKKLLKITVVDQTGVRITGKQAIIRNFSKLFISEEILPLDVILGMILERLDPEKTRNQRGLDILAETIVIKQK